MIFVDSSVWIDWLGGAAFKQARTLQALRPDADFIVGDLVLVEVLQGIADAARFAWVRQRLFNFTLVQVAGVEISIQAANHYRHLRSIGVTPRGTIDLLIATRCIAEGWPLLAKDRDYRPFAKHCGLELMD